MRRIGYRDRIRNSAVQHQSRIVLSLDLPPNSHDLLNTSLKLIRSLGRYIAAAKIGLHLLLPLSTRSEIAVLTRAAHDEGVQVIADLKLNDIASTNIAATSNLWDAGFDAVTCNPFVGWKGAMQETVEAAHKLGNGVIPLVYMSHPGAVEGYGLRLSSGRRVYEELAERAVRWRCDGIVVGATSPRIIHFISTRMAEKIPIYSPGVGAQGGDPREAVNAGADFLIIGRVIVGSRDPLSAIKHIHRETWASP